MIHCDQFVLVDHVQFLKKAFQNRNYIRSKAGKLLLTVPVLTKGRPTQRINEVLINNGEMWARKHWRAISLNYHGSPFFNEYKDFFENLYTSRWERLVDLNSSIISYLMQCFGIEKKVFVSSQYNIVGWKTDMLIDLCTRLGADTYVSGWGAKAYVDVEKFRQHALKHRFVKFVHPTYQQCDKPFIPGLSVLDLLFNYGPEAKMVLAEARGLSSVEEGDG